MQISTTRTISSVKNVPGGFTLIEILVVIAMIGILTSAVVINFSPGDATYRLRADLDRFTSVVEMARHRAMMRNRDWGIHINQEDYHFTEYNPEINEWVERIDRTFKRTPWPNSATIQLEVEINSNSYFMEIDDLPDILIFSSKEMVPFRLILRTATSAKNWVVETDGISKVQVIRGQI